METAPSWAGVRAEILTQADVMAATIETALLTATRVADAARARGIARILIVGAGASLHAAEAMRWWVEELAAVPCEPVPALEYLAYTYRRDTARTLVVAISSSGRASLTLDALRRALAGPSLVVGVTDAADSPFATEVHVAMGTASAKQTGWPTQTTTAAMAALAALGVALAPPNRRAIAAAELRAIPALLSAVVTDTEGPMRDLAVALCAHEVFGFVGAGPAWGVAHDGAMLVTMATADCAIAWETEEMHHGDQAAALIRAGAPIFVLAPEGAGWARAMETAETIETAGGRALVLGTEKMTATVSHVTRLPVVPEYLSPFVSLAPLHWFAYYLAVTKVGRATHHARAMLIEELADSPAPTPDTSPRGASHGTDGQ
ncbi:MAG: SIS domain-containing protein [Chloroflexota bacterium]|nr:SIS domain-containing protein [Chloroflexota bacterium]